MHHPLKYTDPTGYQVYNYGTTEGPTYGGSGNPFGMFGERSTGPGGGGVGPGIGLNGAGLDGVYYDWYTGTYRSTEDGNSVSWQYTERIVSKYSYQTVYLGKGSYNEYGNVYQNASGNLAVYALMPSINVYSAANSGGNWENTAIDHIGKGLGGVGLLTKGRELAEWEFLRQAKFNRAISGDFSKPIKHSLRSIRWAGRGFTLAGGIIGGVNFAMSDKSWGDYGQLGVSMLSTGLTLGSATAPIGIGIGVIDAFGGFNGFYNYLDNQQNFYNNTGGIMAPINGIPSFIPLK